ncbi:MAG: hypothetical protein MUC93_13435 [Bacteroidales bacterium]|jgi:hypothetical protein|nr:hypothetical protein [Bacteroidales bacterium]
MKKSLFIICTAFFLFSCTEEVPKARLLEFKINGQLNSYEGYAYRYTDYNDDAKLGYDWHIYNLGQNALYIQAYDNTFTKTSFSYPEFQIKYTVELTEGQSKTYEAAGGQFRLLGQEMGDISGDFHFKMKNILNPLDSVMINEGYFRIWLEKRDRIFSE